MSTGSRVAISASGRLAHLRQRIKQLVPVAVNLVVSAVVTLVNAWLSYLTIIHNTLMIVGNYSKLMIASMERYTEMAVSAIVEQACHVMKRLGRPTRSIIRSGATINSAITMIAGLMTQAIDGIVDISTSALSRVITWVRSTVTPMIRGRRAQEAQEPVAPDQSKKEDPQDKKKQDPEEPVNIKPVP